MHQLNTKIGTLEERLDNMSMASNGKDDLDKKDEVKKDEEKKDEVKKEASKSQIWPDNPRTQRRHAISKSKSGRKQSCKISGILGINPYKNVCRLG